MVLLLRNILLTACNQLSRTDWLHIRDRQFRQFGIFLPSIFCTFKVDLLGGPGTKLILAGYYSEPRIVPCYLQLD